MLTGLWRVRGDESGEMPPPDRSQRRARLRGGLILAGLAVLTVVPSVLDVGPRREPGHVAIGFAAIGTLLIALAPHIMANSEATDRAAMRWIHDAVVASTSTGIRASRQALIALGVDRREHHRYLPCRNAHPLLYTLLTWAALVTIYAGAVALAQR